MRLRLEGERLADLEARVLAEYGRNARIVYAELVTVGGILGFFARRHYEVTVEIDEARAVRRPPSGVPDALLDLPARVGIAALLNRAEECEDRLNEYPGHPVSTRSGTLADILDDLAAVTAAPQQSASLPDPLR